MKGNRSLGISVKFQELQKANIIGLLAEEYPKEDFIKINENSRNRIFSTSETLLTMILTASQADKTLKNSVNLFYQIHQNKRNEMLEMMREEEKKEFKRKRGRPKKYKIPKSLEKDISQNTAAYSNARQRVPIEAVNKLFKATQTKEVQNQYSHWYGYPVFISDGSYLQMQDTTELRKIYEVKHKGKASSGYPQGLLQVAIDRGSGQVAAYKLSDRHTSELKLFHEMIDELPKGCIVLLDDLYNCYEIMAKCQQKGIEIVLPAKRKRKYTIKEEIEKGDEIIEIEAPERRSAWIKKPEEIPRSIQLRRIICISPEGKEYILHTSVLKKEIKKEEIQVLYFSRWDIEIGIREIKTIMDINVLRSKTPEMIIKELAISLTTYNLIRKIIYASVEGLSFSPKTDFIYEFYTHNKVIFVDKKNRLYNRWSSGRGRAEEADTKRGVT